MGLQEEMMQLAEQFASSRDELDFELSSLESLEASIPREPIRESTTQIWGAYLGETIRRQHPDDIRWVDFETASTMIELIAELEHDYDVAAALAIGEGAVWFPLAKVEKFQRHGSEDSLMGFARAVLSPLRTDDAEQERARRAEHNAKVDEAASVFHAEPTTETLHQLRRAFTTFTPERHYPAALERVGLVIDELEPFLSQAPRGRGWKRVEPSRDAAFFVAWLVHGGIAPRDDTVAMLREHLSGRKKVARAAAAETLATIDACALRTDGIIDLVQHDNRAVADGAWEALSSLAGAVRMADSKDELGLQGSTPRAPRGVATLEITPLVPTILAGLEPRSPRRRLALETLRNWTASWRRRREVAPFAAVLMSLLDDDDDKDAALAAQLLMSYLWGIVHGHAERDPSVEGLASRGAPFDEPIARIVD